MWKKIGTGRKTTKHKTQLKLMPKALPADDAIAPTARQAPQSQLASFTCVHADNDGACLFWSLPMGVKHQLDDDQCFVDDGEAALQLRLRLVMHSKNWLKSLAPPELSRASTIVRSEMKDDPNWQDSHGKFPCNRFHDHLSVPTTFGTCYSVACFARMEGYTVHIFQKNGSGELVRVNEHVGISSKRGSPI